MAADDSEGEESSAGSLQLSEGAGQFGQEAVWSHSGDAHKGLSTSYSGDAFFKKIPPGANVPFQQNYTALFYAS